MNNYAILNTQTNKCVNIIVWNGIDQFNLPNDHIIVDVNNIKINDDVEQINGVWQTKQINGE